jgi:hypothetical protein
MKLSNLEIINLVRDITVAKLQGSTGTANDSTGEKTAAFMQAVYDKFVELNKED